MHLDDAPMIFLYYPGGSAVSHAYVKTSRSSPPATTASGRSGETTSKNSAAPRCVTEPSAKILVLCEGTVFVEPSILGMTRLLRSLARKG